MKTAILGSSGYTGLLLLRLLAEHPDVSEIYAVSSSNSGNTISELDPGLPAKILEKTQSTNHKLITNDQLKKLKPDVIFAALPHLMSAKLCGPYFGSSVIIDLSADFRIKDPRLFEQAYGQTPPRADLLEQSVYGLAEWNTGKIKEADLIANPGCYPTSALLPLLPLAKEKLLRGNIFINSLSGISGAGKKAKVQNLFVERSENCGAYLPGKSHRHQSEILQEILNVNQELDCFFTPHLVPLKRGMFTTTAVHIDYGLSSERIGEILKTAYTDRPFIRIFEKRIPQSRDVWGSNRCDISWRKEGEVLYLFSAIDNLMKGASGQAIQNMNIRFGLPEQKGLPDSGQL